MRTEKSHLVGVDRLRVVAALDEVERCCQAGEQAGAVAVQGVDHVRVGRLHVVLTIRNKKRERKYRAKAVDAF